MVEHLHRPENKRLVGPVALLQRRPHGRGREVKCEGASHDEHGGRVDVLEGQVANKLGLDDGADVREVCAKVVHGVNSHARGDGRVDLAEVCRGLAEEFLGFTVV